MREFNIIKLDLNPPVGDLSSYKVYIIRNSLIKFDSNCYFSVLIYNEANIYILFYMNETFYNIKPQEEEVDIDINSIYIK